MNTKQKLADIFGDSTPTLERCVAVAHTADWDNASLLLGTEGKKKFDREVRNLRESTYQKSLTEAWKTHNETVDDARDRFSKDKYEDVREKAKLKFYLDTDTAWDATKYRLF